MENNKDFKKINIYVIDDNIQKENKDKIISATKNYSNHDLIFINQNGADIKNKYSLNNLIELHDSLTAYLRLFLASILPEDVDKVLYLDCDG